MDAIAYSTFRGNLKSYMRQVHEESAPILVTAKDPADNVVVMNASDYDSLMETFRIYENPALLEKIQEGMREAAEGRMVEHDLIEVDDD